MRLTADILTDHYNVATWCGDFLRFCRLFPDGAEITEDSCIGVAGEFDWANVAASLLHPALYRIFCKQSEGEFRRLVDFVKVNVGEATVDHRYCLVSDVSSLLELEDIARNRRRHFQARLFAQLFRRNK